MLGAGGVTGAAYQVGTLMALHMATGWWPGDADVIVGTSSGAFLTALIRGDATDLDSLTDESLAGKDLEEWLQCSR